MKNTFGSALSLTIFGESHGRAIGAVLDGMAAGVPVDDAFLAACMDKRRARGDGLSTPRVEADRVQFLSGVVNGRTTGTAIALMIENQNTRSADYEMGSRQSLRDHGLAVFFCLKYIPYLSYLCYNKKCNRLHNEKRRGIS